MDYAETEGGPFILLPLELKKKWTGVGDDDDESTSDYARTEQFGQGIGVLDVGDGQALIFGTAEVTAFLPAGDGGVLIQRVYGDEDDDVVAATKHALASAEWKATGVKLNVGKGKLALFDSACAYEDADE